MANLSQLQTAVASLRDGGIVAYPTEAVWGLGCDPYNQSAVNKLLSLKQRSVSKGLILVAADIDQLAGLLSPLSDCERLKLQATWPGATTWVIEDNNQLFPSWIKGQYSTVAVRVSAHPVVEALCSVFGGVLVSTSLNAYGMPHATSQSQAQAYFGASVDCYLAGSIGDNQQPSSIYSLSTGDVLR